MTIPAPPPNPPTAYAPTPAQVHALIARREAFTATSRPSSLEVDGLALQLAHELAAEVIGDLPASLTIYARGVLAYGVASLVELSYFPEQAFDAGSTSEQLRARYLEGLKRLRQLLADLGLLRGAAGDGGGDGGELPARRPRVGSIRVLSATAPVLTLVTVPAVP